MFILPSYYIIFCNFHFLASLYISLESFLFFSLFPLYLMSFLSEQFNFQLSFLSLVHLVSLGHFRFRELSHSYISVRGTQSTPSMARNFSYFILFKLLEIILS